MAQLMSRVKGHDKQKQLFRHFLETQHIPHSLVFCGPDGVGKFLTALAWAQTLMCENSSSMSENTQQACGVCGSCIRVEKQQHEYLKIVQPQGSSQIKIEQVREILDFLSLSSGGKTRVVIIDQAQALNPQASNALLKTLEEPQNQVFFILVTSDIRLLMPTIRSRSQTVQFQGLSKDELQGIFSSLESWMYSAARGRAGLLQQISKTEFVEKRNHDLSLFLKFWQIEKFLVSGLMEEFPKERQQAISLIKNWIYFSKDVLVLKLELRDQVVFKDQLFDFKQLLFVESSVWLQFIERLTHAEKEAEKLDLQLLFESLWIQFCSKDNGLQIDVSSKVNGVNL